MYPHKTPILVQRFFKDVLWRKSGTEKVLYLTFDDGPKVGVTEWVLDKLDQYNAKATFFCVGNNVLKYPELYARLLESGHSVGNHSFNHLNGWKTDFDKYIQNIEQAADCIDSNYYRPPYGKLTWKQYQFLKDKYKIVMWDVVAGDFDTTITKEQCYQAIKKHSKPGSIIVLHDNIRHMERMKYCVEKTLEDFSGEGYSFGVL